MATRGFTLIELLVSVTLLLVLSGLLVAGYNGYNSTQTVTQAGTTFKSNLRAIRTAATSGVKPEGCDMLIGYQVTFTSVASYTSSALCSVGGITQEVGIVSTYTLPASVQFSVLPQNIIFYTVNQGSSTDQTITLTGNGRSIGVTVSKSGVVSDAGPTATPTPTPPYGGK